jgi:hypothetical protein
MVEVFKTNVNDRDHAARLIAVIHKEYTEYTANFDLEDCDRILRIECNSGHVRVSFVIRLLEYFGFTADVLPA